MLQDAVEQNTRALYIQMAMQFVAKPMIVIKEAQTRIRLNHAEFKSHDRDGDDLTTVYLQVSPVDWEKSEDSERFYKVVNHHIALSDIQDISPFSCITRGDVSEITTTNIFSVRDINGWGRDDFSVRLQLLLQPGNKEEDLPKSIVTYTDSKGATRQMLTRLSREEIDSAINNKREYYYQALKIKAAELKKKFN